MTKPEDESLPMTDGDAYEGIPLEELLINDIDWTHRGEHIRTRSQRKALQGASK